MRLPPKRYRPPTDAEICAALILAITDGRQSPRGRADLTFQIKIADGVVQSAQATMTLPIDLRQPAELN